MPDVRHHLNALRRRIEERNASDVPPDYVDRLAVTEIAGLFDLDFYGDSFGESYVDLLGAIARSEVAAKVRAISLRGPDEGTNGTRNWDLEPLLAGGAAFPRLETFAVQQNSPGDHNRTVIGESYDEEGVLGRLLAKAPSLRELTVPSAPAPNFFEVGPRPLRFLSVDAGYDTQAFIRNLARTSVFRHLTHFEWGEFNETYLDDFPSGCTSLEGYRALLVSPAFSNVGLFVWRNPVLSADEIRTLKQLRPDLGLLVIRSTAEYVGRP